MGCGSKGFGVIGVGVWGETHLKTYSSVPGARLAAICDLNTGLLDRRREQYQPGLATTDYHELLACDEVGAVSVVTPDFLHREVAVAACEAGKNVLLEKPMATTVADAQAIADAAAANGVHVMVDFHNRWNPAFYGLKQSVLAGELGELQMLSMRLNDTLYVPTQMLSWAGTSSVAWFLASHALDVVRWLFDDEIVRVYSVSRSRVLAARGVDTPDFFQTICELRGGGVAHVENCWILSEALPTVFDLKAELVGSTGTAYVDGSTHRMVQKYAAAELSPFSTSPGTAYPDVAVVTNVQGKPGGFGVESIRHFAESIISGTAPIVGPEDGIRNTAALVALHESARLGQPVEVADLA